MLVADFAGDASSVASRRYSSALSAGPRSPPSPLPPPTDDSGPTREPDHRRQVGMRSATFHRKFLPCHRAMVAIRMRITKIKQIRQKVVSQSGETSPPCLCSQICAFRVGMSGLGTFCNSQAQTPACLHSEIERQLLFRFRLLEAPRDGTGGKPNRPLETLAA